MKKYFFVIILFVSTLAYSQTNIKILFDATRAEMAGNADWVIDASTHNIGFSNGPAVTGQGNESNPAIIPSPAQSGVNANTPKINHEHDHLVDRIECGCNWNFSNVESRIHFHFPESIEWTF
ncbi:MAG: hypothetical protein NT084_15740 [Bacteroidetes bacterium]|nr:hypothetical protein [Bacteroidota bacterium]